MKSREPRRKVMLKARLRVGANWRDACILDLSSRGMMIKASEPLRDGSYIEVRRGRHLIVARVVWSKDRRCGLVAQDPLPTDALIAESDHSDGTTIAHPQERRRDHRPPPPRAFAHERSRWRSRAFEFALVVMIGGACGTFAYGAVSDALSQPLATVETALAGG